jgi:ABC-type transport system involved in multi-copper enzyme maturation permease subunit
MRTVWQSLIWKEWHEHKWKLVSLTAILWSIAALGLFDPERGTLVGIHAALVMAIVPLAIFIGLGVAAGEQSRGTLTFLQALPVPMWRVAIHKLAAGLATSRCHA